jgi:hypothetical protein
MGERGAYMASAHREATVVAIYWLETKWHHTEWLRIDKPWLVVDVPRQMKARGGLPRARVVVLQGCITISCAGCQGHLSPVTAMAQLSAGWEMLGPPQWKLSPSLASVFGRGRRGTER